MAAGFERIFEVGPVFRAEKSFTSKHTTEFTGFDLEFSYIESYRDVMQIEAEILTYALGVVNEKYGASRLRRFWVRMTTISMWNSMKTVPPPLLKSGLHLPTHSPTYSRNHLRTYLRNHLLHCIIMYARQRALR